PRFPVKQVDMPTGRELITRIVDAGWHIALDKTRGTRLEHDVAAVSREVDMRAASLVTWLNAALALVLRVTHRLADPLYITVLPVKHIHLTIFDECHDAPIGGDICGEGCRADLADSARHAVEEQRAAMQVPACGEDGIAPICRERNGWIDAAYTAHRLADSRARDSASQHIVEEQRSALLLRVCRTIGTDIVACQIGRRGPERRCAAIGRECNAAPRRSLDMAVPPDVEGRFRLAV